MGSAIKNAKTPTNVEAGASLARALNQSQDLRNKLERCAGELSSLIAVLEQEIAQHLPIGQIEHALDRSEEVESKVQEAAEDVSSMSRDLEQGIKEHKNLERRLSSSRTQGKKARYLAFHDSVTGLPNRTLFNDRLSHALAQAERHAWPVVVMFIDLDKFKSINDSYGHDVGDKALQMVAQRLQASLRAEDTVSRYGGDEFLCMISGFEDELHIANIAKKIISNIAEPCEVNGAKITMSPSIGIAVYPPNGETAEVLLKKADAAMYRAKQNHKGYLFVHESAALGKPAPLTQSLAGSSRRGNRVMASSRQRKPSLPTAKTRLDSTAVGRSHRHKAAHRGHG